ncbi:hypothetical protein OOT08_17145, partial [Leucobacter sp. M11]|nr:hypothetical protein [Leucobacter sp. M11]
MNPSTAPAPSRPRLPRAARARIVAVGLGWVLVALAECGAAWWLALAIRDGGRPGPVLLAAAVSLAVTVFVSRSGYLAGARLAGDLY